MDIVIYGAGNYCDYYLKNLDSNKYMIKGIIDGDSDKWGLKKNGYTINPPDAVERIQYDGIIITVEKYESVLDELLMRDIDKNKIFIYSTKKNDIFSFNYVYEKYLEEKIYKSNAIKQVKTGLLLESFREGEYFGFERLFICGEEDDYILIKNFFCKIDQKKTVIHYKGNDQIKVSDKIIFCGENYKNDLNNIKNQSIFDKQWIILPFFDVGSRVCL